MSTKSWAGLKEEFVRLLDEVEQTSTPIPDYKEELIRRMNTCFPYLEACKIAEIAEIAKRSH